MTLTTLNEISIANIAIYTPILAIAIFLATQHGFGRDAGWLYLIIFSLARIIGSALQLATINDPTNVSLIAGYTTLQSIGLSPLILVMLALINRVLEGIRQARDTIMTPRVMRLVQTVVIVGLILGIVGGSKSASQISDLSKQGAAAVANYSPPTESKVGLALMIVGFAILTLSIAMTTVQIGSIESGEKRILLALAIAWPFVLIRIIYACISTFGHDMDFKSYGGSPNYTNYLIGMSVVMEMVAVVIFEGFGLVLHKHKTGYREGQTSDPAASRKPGHKHADSGHEMSGLYHNQYNGRESA